MASPSAIESSSGDEEESTFVKNVNESDEESDDAGDHCACAEVMPYLFEPQHSSDSPEAAALDMSIDIDESWRLSDLSWCQCDNCVLMADVTECVCCREYTPIRQKLDCLPNETDIEVPPKCICNHPGFGSVCLDIWVLQAAYLVYRQKYGHHNAPPQERYRYTAYRQLVRWCWGYLGKNIRIPIPSCAVQKIRETFPSDSYHGFSLPMLD